MTSTLPAKVANHVLLREGKQAFAPAIQAVFANIEWIEPDHFASWTSERLVDWLGDAAGDFYAHEQTTDAMRVGFGLAVWQLRSNVGDGEFGRCLDVIARDAGVSVRTLQRWREAAQKHYTLPDASKRPAAHKAIKTSKLDEPGETGKVTTDNVRSGRKAKGTRKSEVIEAIATDVPKPLASVTPIVKPGPPISPPTAAKGHPRTNETWTNAGMPVGRVPCPRCQGQGTVAAPRQAADAPNRSRGFPYAVKDCPHRLGDRTKGTAFCNGCGSTMATKVKS